MIFTLIVMTVLLLLAVALLKLTGSGVTAAARSVNDNQSQQAANVAIQQAIAWLEAQDLTDTSLEVALGDSEGAERTAVLGRSCYEWSFTETEGAYYDAEAGTVTITGRGVSPGALDAGEECVAGASTSDTTTLTATVKLAPSALGYALSGNGIYLGTQP